MIWYFLNTRWQKKSIKSEEKCKRSKLSWSWSAVTGYYWRPIVLGSCFSKSGGGKPGLFLFLSMSQNNDKFDFKWKKHRWCDWDSNLGPQDGRRRRIQQTMAGPIIWTLRCRKLFKPSKYLAFYYLSCKFSFECKIK